MIRNENYGANGLLSAEVIDLDAGTVTVEDGQGNVVEAARPLTDDELARYAVPVDPYEVYATAIANAQTMEEVRAAGAALAAALGGA